MSDTYASDATREELLREADRRGAQRALDALDKILGNKKDPAEESAADENRKAANA